MRMRMQKLAPLEARHPVSGRAMDIDFAEDLRIDFDDLHGELKNWPRRVEQILQLRDVAADELNRAKHEEYNTEEALYLEISDRLGKGTSETAIKTNAKADPRMRAAYRARMDAERRFKAAESVVQALMEKRVAMILEVRLRTRTTEEV